MKTIKYFGLLGLLLITASCQDFLEPNLDNSLSQEQLQANPAFAEGLLMSAYNQIQNEYDFTSDAASDDATSNDVTGQAIRMATGGWNSTYNPVSRWNQAYRAIAYINNFLSIVEDVRWGTSPELNEGHKKRLIGEAHGLRAFFELQLLQAHGGEGTDGQLLGFPILTKPLTISDNFQLPRGTYAECVAQIVSDCNVAVNSLPLKYADKSGNTVFNSTSGSRFVNRVDGTISKAILAKTLLLASSPAYAKSGISSEQAASAFGELLKDLGGLAALSNSTDGFYKLNGNNFNDKDLLWFLGPFNRNSLEEANLPPSLFGRGNLNPSQNLVDAFPMKSGIPINIADSGYDPANPYKDRDARLAKFIITNGGDFKGTINTSTDDPTDGIGNLQTSTRTGYYLKKFMDANVNLTPGNTNSANHIRTLLRVTELVLGYAEAANLAWGPDADPKSYGFTARTVLAALRKRAGISQPDAYLNAISNKLDMDNLIRTERRIELSFEGNRFFDIRRWNDLNAMKSDISAAFISPSSIQIRSIEPRVYQNHMVYGPIPLEEVLKTNIVQNKGW